MPETVKELGAKVRAKYPDYADMTDEDLGRKVKAKFPTEYADFVDLPGQTQISARQDETPQPPREYQSNLGTGTQLGGPLPWYKEAEGVFRNIGRSAGNAATRPIIPAEETVRALLPKEEMKGPMMDYGPLGPGGVNFQKESVAGGALAGARAVEGLTTPTTMALMAFMGLANKIGGPMPMIAGGGFSADMLNKARKQFLREPQPGDLPREKTASKLTAGIDALMGIAPWLKLPGRSKATVSRETPVVPPPATPPMVPEIPAQAEVPVIQPKPTGVLPPPLIEPSEPWYAAKEKADLAKTTAFEEAKAKSVPPPWTNPPKVPIEQKIGPLGLGGKTPADQIGKIHQTPKLVQLDEDIFVSENVAPEIEQATDMRLKEIEEMFTGELGRLSKKGRNIEGLKEMTYAGEQDVRDRGGMAFGAIRLKGAATPEIRHMKEAPGVIRDAIRKDKDNPLYHRVRGAVLRDIIHRYAGEIAELETKKTTTPFDEIFEEPVSKVEREPGEEGFAETNLKRRIRGGTPTDLDNLRGSGWLLPDGSVVAVPSHLESVGSFSEAKRQGLIRVGAFPRDIYVEKTVGKATDAQLSVLSRFKRNNPEKGLIWQDTVTPDLMVPENNTGWEWEALFKRLKNEEGFTRTKDERQSDMFSGGKPPVVSLPKEPEKMTIEDIADELFGLQTKQKDQALKDLQNRVVQAPESGRMSKREMLGLTKKGKKTETPLFAPAKKGLFQ